MSKTNFSSTISASLNGRSSAADSKGASEGKKQNTPPAPKKEPEKKPPKTKKVKKSNAGRKAIPDEEKKKQIALTIKPESLNALSECDADYKKLLSRYIDKNIDTIVEELKKL